MMIFESIQKQIDKMDDIKKGIVTEAIKEISLDVGFIDFLMQLENMGIDTRELVSEDVYKALELDECVNVFDIIKF